MAKTFESLYLETDEEGDSLIWEWDPDEMVFKATDSAMRIYTLRPLTAEMELDESEVDDIDEDYED